MRDTDLYRQVLGLEEPWFVTRVDLQVAEEKVDVWVEHRKAVRWPCPQCQRELGCRDHAEERTWRHLDTCQFRTFLHARVPRVECPEHGVLQVRVPWAEARARFTALMERFVIDVLQQCATVQGARRLLRLSWDEVWGVMERSVRRGQARKRQRVTPYVGVDEKAFRKGHNYVTIVSDLRQSSVEYVAEDRKTDSLSDYWRGLPPEQREGVQAVTMDMWEPYIQATREHLPEGDEKIVFDRFHIMSHLNQAVDRVRRQENRLLCAEGEEALKGTKYLWLYSRENLPDRHLPVFQRLQRMNLKVARAWAIKESFRHMWDYTRPGWARRFFRRWFHWATHSRLGPIRKVAYTLKRHLENILTFCRHRITMGVAEGLNSKIMAIKRRACGYRNRSHFKTAIYFFCGGLDLYPR
jgi:transposase